MNMSRELNFIIQLLFTEKIIHQNEVKCLDLEKIVKISSENLIIPLFYSKIKSKRLIDYFPKDFVKYFCEIHHINSNRNKILIDELNQISNFLKLSEINHVFLKGSAMVLNDLYDDIGVRMIGDIDFLIEEKKIKSTEKLFDENNYKKITNYDFFERRHLVRRVNSEKLFAVEPHTYLIEDKKVNIINRFKNDLVKNKNYPSLINLYLHTILSYQINDHGSLKLSYSLKTIYDVKLIDDKIKIKQLDDIKIDKNLKKFILIVKKLGIEMKLNNKLSSNELFFENLIISNKFASLFHKYFSNRIIYVKIKIDKIFKFLKSSKYRKHIFNKFSR